MAEGADSDPAPEPAPAAAEPPAGPYDSAEAPAGVRLLDLGSLRVPALAGVEIKVQANQQGIIQQLYLVHGESVLQLGVFAAPRTESLWDEVREEISKQLFADGVAAQEARGEYGVELHARVRTQQGLKDLRFVGVDGPRWMVRAVFQGPAAVDPASAEPLTQCLRGLVVERGTDARPAREPLPLRLSTELAEQVQQRAQGSAPDSAGTNGAALPASPDGAGAGVASPAAGVPTDGAAPRRKPSPRPRRD